MHVICRASTDDDVRRRTTMDDNGRRRPLLHSYAVRLTYDVVRCVSAEDLQHTDWVLFGLTSDSPRGRLLDPDCPDPGATAPGELPGE